jgi:predicted HTH transcriptional regulator
MLAGEIPKVRPARGVTVKAGLDSMPAARRQALELLITLGDAATTTDVATELDLPSRTTHRVLEDLAAHGVLTRESQGQGKADLWHVVLWTLEQWRAATLPEKSSNAYCD